MTLTEQLEAAGVDYERQSRSCDRAAARNCYSERHLLRRLAQAYYYTARRYAIAAIALEDYHGPASADSTLSDVLHEVCFVTEASIRWDYASGWWHDDTEEEAFARRVRGLV